MDTQSARPPAAVTSSAPGTPPVAASSIATTAAPPAAVSTAMRAPMPGPESAPINRELSLLAFNRRVLSLAEDPDVPLLERLRFLCILGSNLDEFFEIRVAGVKEQLRAKVPPLGMTLQDARVLFGRIGDEARALIVEQYRALNDDVLPALERAGVRLVRRTEFTAAERAWAASYFQQEVRPLLTPIGLDPAHPFPQVVEQEPELRDRAVGARTRSDAIPRSRSSRRPASCRASSGCRAKCRARTTRS